MFSREVALYQRLQNKGIRVTFITYGYHDTELYTERLQGIQICCNRWRLPASLYEWLIPYLHGFTLSRADLIKTNQTNGADLALRAARRWHLPCIVRQGYLLSEFMEQQYGMDSAQAKQAKALESRVFPAADRIAVTTHAMRGSLANRFPDLMGRIRLIPNYVDTDQFWPSNDQDGVTSPRLIYIGRLNSEQKNLPELLKAVHGLEMEFLIVGQGPLKDEVIRETEQNSRISYLGSIPNHELPRYLNQCTAFILPSLYEGHPKTLIEAMACGLPVIASDVPGINNLIQHGVTGYLCGTDSDSIRNAILTVMNDLELQKQLGQNAREYVQKHFSLDRIVEMEMSLYEEILSETAIRKS